MALSLLVISMIIMIVTLPRLVSGETAVSLSPQSGTAGTLISVVGAGFNGQVIISLGSTELARTYASNMFGRITQTFRVPSIPPATYTITATDAQGITATTTFTVTSTNPTATPKSSSSPSTTGNNNNPITSPSSSYSYYSRDKASPSPVEENDPGFWSLPVIGITVAAIITASVLTLIIVSRRGGGRPDRTFDEEPLPPYRPEPMSPPRTASTYSSRTSRRPSRTLSYGHQFSKSKSIPRMYRSTARRSASSFTRTCPNCKKVIKDDYNICPYCNKRLR